MNSIPLEAIAGFIGLLAHKLYFIHGRHHSKEGPQIIKFHLAAITLLSASLIYGAGVNGGLWQTWRASSCYMLVLTSSIVIYRLFYHRARHFPGPFAAKITQFYNGPWLSRNLKLHVEQIRLADMYGDFVRIAPNQLLIRDVEALTKIFDPRSGCSKGFHYESFPVGDHFPLVSIDLMDENRRPRRQLWEQAVSPKSIRGYEASVRIVMHDWINKINESIMNDEPLEAYLFSLLLSCDIGGLISVSKAFKLVEAGKTNRLIDILGWQFTSVATLGPEFSWPVPIVKWLELDGQEKEFRGLIESALIERMERNDDPRDFIKFFLDDFHSGKPKQMNTQLDLVIEAGEVLVAALHTVACAMAFSIFYLARDAALRSRLRQELAPLRQDDGEFSGTTLQSHRMLNAFINEVLRMYPPGSSGGNRVTPKEGITVGDVWIPGETEVDTPAILYHRSEKYFKQANEFILERWTTRPELILDKRAYFPFLLGSASCAGRAFALLELRMLIAYTVTNFDFSFAPGEDGTKIETMMEDHLTFRPGPLYVKFAKVK